MLDNLEQKSSKKSSDCSKIKTNKSKNAEQGTGLTSTTAMLSTLSADSVPHSASSHEKQIKTPFTLGQMQAVIQVRYDNILPSIQSIRQDQQRQAQMDHRPRKLANIAQTGTANKVKHKGCGSS